MAADYQGLAKQLVASLKFAGNQAAARVMARSMVEAFAPPTDCLITHMPATTPHIRARGYDQAALLARHVARISGRERDTLLARLGSDHQLGANREQRLKQLTNALRVRRPDKLVGRHILLVDDVLTTGASVRAATAALLEAGAVSVSVLVFAQAVAKE